MRSKMLKKAAAVFMAAVMVFSMTACGKKSGGSGSKEKEDTKNCIYAGEPIDIVGVQGDISSPMVAGDKLYFSTYEWIEGDGEAVDDGLTGDSLSDLTDSQNPPAQDAEDTEGDTEAGDDEGDTAAEGDTEEGSSADAPADTEEGDSEEDSTVDVDMEWNGKSVYHLYMCDLDGSSLEEIPFAQLEENEYFSNWVVDKDGNFSFLISKYNGTTNEYSMMKMDNQGKEIFRQNITKDLGVGEDNYVSRMIADSEGNYIVLMESKIIIFDKDAKKVNEVKSDSWIEGMALTRDGAVVCAASDENSAVVQVLDTKSGSFGEKYKLEGISYFQSSDSLMDGQEYDFYYKDSSSVYGYSIADKKGTKVLDFVASNMNGQQVYSMTFLPDGTFINTEYDMTAGKTVCSRYKKVDPSTLANKKTLTLGGVWVDEQVKEAVIKFNKSSDEYNITIKDYSGMDDGETMFAADIVAGNIPDIICFNSLSITQYIAKGVIADLTEYYEKEGLDKELLPTVAEAIKIDGKYYSIAPSAYLQTMAANSEIVHGKTGWTVAEMLEIIKEQKGKSQPFYWNEKNSILYTMIGAAMSDYVDWSTGKCSFNSQEFKDILTVCNEIGVDEEVTDYESRESEPSMIQSGKLFLMEQYLDYESTVMMSKMFRNNLSFIGFPCKDGKGSFFSFINEFGISSKSENKEGAWEFLKTMMTKEYQHNLWSGLPTRKDAYEMYKKANTTKVSYTDEFGNEVTPLNGGWTYADFDVKIGPLSDEEVALFESVLANTNKRYSQDYKLTQIIQEEVAAYFKGDKTVDEICDLIQGRVSTYVNENR